MKETKPIPFHAWPSKRALEFLHSAPEGLSEEEAKVRIERYGENTIERGKKSRPFFLFFKQFQNALVYVLLAAAGVSFLADHFIDAWVILGVVLFNAIVGFILEYRAEKSVEALRGMLAPKAKTLRSGRVVQIDSRFLVPGDVVFLQEGDAVPADGRILFADEARAVEGALTGESVPQEKVSKAAPEDAPLGDRSSMFFLGTYLVSGEARMLVTSTGSKTELGGVAKKMEAIERTSPHFQARVGTLTKQMGIIAIFGTVATFLAGVFLAGLGVFETFLAATATLVSGIPEGLPAVLTIVLAVSAVRMARRKAIVRSLPSIETLAVVDTILTDKTGTLTENSMNIVKAYAFGEKDVEISGKGWEPQGAFTQSGKGMAPLEHPVFRRIARIAGSCQSASVYADEADGTFDVVGDPTEAAMLVFSRRAGISDEVLRDTQERVDDLPFRSSRQFRATLVKDKEEKTNFLYVAGAPEAVLARCEFVYSGGKVVSLGDGEQKEILDTVRSWSGEALRVLAFAYRERIDDATRAREEDAEKLVFAGLVGMMDTPREGVREAVAEAKRAGIRVIMTTGDHKETASAIAREVGIAEEGGRAYTQEELERMDDKAFAGAVKSANVFARLSPDMKLRITEVLQGAGRMIAVTGDGVNDALALRRADIGVAMGRTGSDVAKQAGSVVLADDNFATIVAAIEEGRIVFNNVQRASSFLITTNFAEQVTIVGALAMALPLPLLPAQILWLNLVTEGLPDVALAAEPSHGRALHNPPMKREANILSKEILPYLILIMSVMAAMSLLTFLWFLSEGLDHARSAAFVVLSATQLFNAFNMRSLHRSVFDIGFFKNKYVVGAFVISSVILFATIYAPPLQAMLGFSPIAYSEFFVLFLLSSIVLVIGDVYKRVKFAKR